MYYRRIERSDAPVENSIDKPRCEQLVPKSLGYEDVKHSVQTYCFIHDFQSKSFHATNVQRKKGV
jgi:hypothetical protein